MAESKPGFRVMTPEEKEAFARIKLGQANDDDLMLFSKYSDDELVNQFQFGPKSVEAVSAIRPIPEQAPSNTPDPMSVATAQYAGRTTALTPEEQYRMQQEQAKITSPNSTMAKVDNINPENKVKPTPDTTDAAQTNSQTNNQTQGTGLSKMQQDSVDNVLAGWTPILAGSLNNTVDPSGQSAGWRDQANIYDQNAAANSKILQWNKQRATDNRLADKIAAAQAHEKWQQNAASLGAEGGATAVADQNTTTTADKMAEKQFQQQAMDTATKNQAEVNRNKLESSAAKTDAKVKDWSVNYNQNLDTEATNLSQAAGANKKDNTSEEKPNTQETTETTESKPDTKVEGTGSVAQSNQASDATQDATTQTAADKEMSDIITKATQIVEGFKNGEVTSNQASVEQEYEQLKQKYQALIDKGVIDNPPEFPFMETTASLNEKQEPENSTQSIANTLSGLKI